MITESTHIPNKNYPYFYYDPEGDGFSFFKTEADRDAEIKSVIQSYLSDEGWNKEVTGVVAGKLTHQVTMVDVETRDGEIDEDGCDETGNYWDSDWEYKCNYELKPLGFICPSTKTEEKS